MKVISFLFLDSATKMSKLSFENEKRMLYPMLDAKTKSTANEILHIKIGLSNRSINYIRKVLRYDDFLGNIVGYLSNIIILLYIFNVIYNSFGSKVYFANKFFIQPTNFELKVREDLFKKIDEIKKAEFKNSPPDGGGGGLGHVNEYAGIDHHNQNDDRGEHQNIPNLNDKPEFINKSDLTRNINNKLLKNIEMKPMKTMKTMKTIKEVESENYTNNKEYINFSEEKNPNNPHLHIFNKENLNILNKKSQNTNNIDQDVNLRKLNNNCASNYFDYNFFEYLIYPLCSRKRTLQKSKFLESSQSFYDFYMDINTYIKKMMELDYLKYRIIRNEAELKVLENFRPVLKDSYKENYGESILELYDSELKSESISKVYSGINEMDSTKTQLLVYDYLLKYY
jgi:hypothetical protein